MELPEKPTAMFHPLIAEWFQSKIGTATDVQAAAWPRIATGEHVLVIAPTGTGKTLTAFLWALNQLVTGELPTGQCSVLYISPLKALNNDIQRNLIGPLGEIRRLFQEHGQNFPEIRVMTRSGDTPQEERRRMQKRPPEIMITTPESLNLMLSSHGGISMLGSLKCVILDEIHAVIDSKRGAHLMSAVERLVPLSGEFQRIALSATVRPPEIVEEFVGGYRRSGGNNYELRRITRVQSDAHKVYDISVHFPKSTADENGKTSTWPAIVDQCREVIRENRSTLIFTNSRRLAETLTWKINADQDELLAYSHHGALSREIRYEVEHRLKAGDLKAIVATSSLEMGIDIGALDEVLLLQSPPAVSSAIQRVGRAGHRVGETSRAVLYPTHPHDLLQAAVLAKNILRQNIEETTMVRCPLDVLAQVLISMTGIETWDIDDLFAEVRRSSSFHSLTREQFDLVLDMLAGRYAETRIRALRSKISIDRLDNTVAARPGALQDLYFSGGTIPDRGYYRLRHAESGSLIGDLDEEYVWEATVGQMMSFGAQSWRIERITHNDVFVTPTAPVARQAPFWKGEEMNRNFHLSQEIANFLEEADACLDDPEYAAYLQREYCLDSYSAEELIDYLKRQKRDCGIPHRHRIMIEHVSSGIDGSPANQVIIHTCWGGCVNRPFAMALAAAWQEKFGADLVIFPADDAIYIQSIEEIGGEELLSLVTPSRLQDLMRKKLEGSGFFGARFREAAGRALLLTKRRMGERMPLWVSRLQSKNLLESVLDYGDFPILLEAWRTCLQDELDLEHLATLLTEVETGAITWSESRHELPSPFAQTMSWRQINQYMYADDTPTGTARSQIKPDLLREVVFTPGLRPSVSKDIIERFVVKRQRLAEGYAPQSARDLLDWVKERLLIPLPEWQSLLKAIERDHGLTEDELLRENQGKLTFLQPDEHQPPLVVAVEQTQRINALWAGDADENLTTLLAEWLRFYGPITPDFIEITLSIEPSHLAYALEDLEDTQRMISGSLIEGSGDTEICDSENFEILLRMARAGAVPDFQPLPAEALPLFVAHHQGLCKPGDSVDDLMMCLGRLSCYESRAELWEETILPARIHPYETSRLDALMQEGQIHWLGAGKGKVTFCLEDDLDIVQSQENEPCLDDLLDLLSDEHARYTLQSLANKTGTGMPELAERLWTGVWNGIISNDSMAALRKGILNDFKLPKLQDTTRHRTGRVGRSTSSRFVGAMPLVGNWYRLPEPVVYEDMIENEERNKDRVRLLLERYGLLFRELLQNESAEFQWKNIFRALRLMELSGEVLGGCFFHGIPGLQFISRQAFHGLRRSLPENAVWWLNACDPASLCGIQLDAFTGQPRRIPGNFIVYRGRQVVAVISRSGKELTILVEPNDDHFQEYLAPIHNLLERGFRPERHLVVEIINGEPAPASPYVDALAVSFDVVRDFNRLFVSKRY